MSNPPHSHSPLKTSLLRCALLCVLPPALALAASAQQASPLAHSTQLIVVTTTDWNAVNGILHRYQRTSPAQPWHPVGQPIPIVVGSNGMAWGIGAQPVPASSPDDPVKHEGDRKSPAGVFRLGTSFGFAPRPPAAWKMPYLALTPTIECVDDSTSKFYNRIVDRSAVMPDWSSSEHMRAVGEYYRWGVEVEQNLHALPQAGSCVFLHIWGGDGGGTEGCTAMARPAVEAILAWLRPSAKPMLVQMPLKKYRQVEKPLHLPHQ